MSKNALSTTVLLATLAACGGGGGGTGNVTGLEGPQQVTIVESSDGSNNTVRLPRGVRAITGSDYETDQTRLWVRDDSMKTLDTINMILSSLAQTHYADQTNAGPYRALVESDERGGGGGERGQTGPEYEEWVINSTRADNSSPQIVSFWVQTTENMGQEMEAIIYGKLTVTAEPSDNQPLGAFSLTFKNLPATAASTSTATLFEGYMRTVARNDGQSEIEFFMSHGDPEGQVPQGQLAMRERVHVVGDPAADTGRAYAEFKHVGNFGGGPFTEQGEYRMQFNAAYVALRDVTNNNTLDVKDRNDFDTMIFRYGVYDATTESRIEQLSGFPIEDDNGNHGWAGFHGIWFPEHVTLTNGMTLYRREWGSSTRTPYTLVSVPGRLEKRTRSSITLADLQGDDLQMFNPSSGNEWRVRFTGTDFVRTATRQQGEWQLEQNPVNINNSFTAGQWVHFWSQARGSVEFSFPAQISGSVPAFVWSATTINADSPELAAGDLTLNGYFHMLRANITSDQANWANGQTPYLPDATGVAQGNQTYVFDKETLMLQLGGNNVNFANGVSITSGPGMWGLNCGPLFPTALQSFNDIPNQTTTYEWMIGTNNWNQLRTLKDAEGAYVSFSAPIRFTYTHSEPGSPFDGRTFFLEWDGMNLHGIPHQENSGDNRWYPLFNIPTGTTLTSGNTSYKVKQLEGEQLMVSVQNPQQVYTAQGFDLDTTITAPTAAPYSDPAIGTIPEVTAAPLYVGGVLQTSNDG